MTPPSASVDRCSRCGRTVERALRELPYVQGASLVVTLHDVPALRCPACGHGALRFPAMRALREAIALGVAVKTTRLGPGELRALRVAAWSLPDFARAIGEAPALVAEWEHEEGGVAHDSAVEAILRQLTLRRLRLPPMSDAALSAAWQRPPTPSVLHVRHIEGRGWQLERDARIGAAPAT